jgi:hypothetical protein
MTIDQVRRLHQAQPFHAFRIHLADSRTIDVAHPELLAINEPGRTVVVAHDGAFEIIDLLLVTSLEMMNGHSKSAARRKH